MNPATKLGALFVICIAAIAFRPQAAHSGGARANRILVRVPPRDLGSRSFDRMPARFHIAVAVDPASLRVRRYDPVADSEIGEPVPFRFDGSGEPPLFMSHYWPPDGRHGGTLVWQHEQRSHATSYYAIEYRPWHANAGVAPRSWIGDGDIEYASHGAFPQVLMVRPFGFDWDGDGLTDVLVGDELGYVTLYRNTGSARTPKFSVGEPLMADGAPVKVKWCAAPVVVDWNGDGLPDLLVAQEPQGVIRYFQNIGTRRQPRLTDRGLLQADGEVLKPPYLPVPEMPPGIFGDKYGSIPAAADWDHDGTLDLLVGTYITGEVYFYRGIGRNPDGTPKLHYVGPLRADGKELDVIWNSTPAVADLNGDGRLELVSGSFGMSATGGDRPQDSRLHYYERAGDAVHELPFPFDGSEAAEMSQLFASGGAPLSTALADMNGDGLTDLLVGTGGGTVVYFENVGDRRRPRFHFAGTLQGDWLPRRWGFDSIVDFRGDGKFALLEGGGGTQVELASGPRFATRTELKTVSGKSMGKRATHGDDFGNAQFYDFDGDGKPDVLFGTVDGNVLLYRNIGTRAEPRFAGAETMTMHDGKPLVAGFAPETKVTDFTVLQGNRAIPAAADLNGDGRTDLIVGNALGQVLYFENVGDNTHPRFSPARQLMKFSGRVFLTAADWDHDGLPDLVVASSGGEAGKQISILRHVADAHHAAFLPPLYLAAPTQIPYPVPAAIDWDHDGDVDLLVASSYGFVYRFDGSFVASGYAEAEELRGEERASHRRIPMVAGKEAQ